ncbi:hypothetical protein PtB15_1B325 [Puccinia triticina]|nr:hypothetical protein PtB15_1B325 [Puccinia triticina]
MEVKNGFASQTTNKFQRWAKATANSYSTDLLALLGIQLFKTMDHYFISLFKNPTLAAYTIGLDDTGPSGIGHLTSSHPFAQSEDYTSDIKVVRSRIDLIDPDIQIMGSKVTTIDSDVKVSGNHNAWPLKRGNTDDNEIQSHQPPSKKQRKRWAALSSSMPLVVATLNNGLSNLGNSVEECLRLNQKSEESGKSALKQLMKILKKKENQTEFANETSPMLMERFMLCMHSILTMVKEYLVNVSVTPPHNIPGVSEKGRMNRSETMIRFLEAFGSPRRFKDRRLLRLIFLSVQKRASHAHHPCEEYPSSPQPLPGGSAGLEWSSRPDVWRDLQSRLAPAPPTSPSTRPQPIQPQLEQLHAHPAQEEAEELLDLRHLQFQLDPSSSLSDFLPSHHPPAPPRAQPHNQPRNPTRNNPEHPSADGKAQDIAASLDRANQKLKSASLDYFDQHSLLTCLVHLVRNKFH